MYTAECRLYHFQSTFNLTVTFLKIVFPNIGGSLNFKRNFADFPPNAIIQVGLSKTIISLRNLFTMCRKVRYIIHSVIFYKIRSHSIFSQNLKFFRENNLLIAHRVKHILGNSNFDQLDAKLRKFHMFDVKIDTLDYTNHLRYLRRMAQKGFYRNVNFANFNPLLLSSIGLKMKNSKSDN